jgi:hypothetical protein
MGKFWQGGWTGCVALRGAAAFFDFSEISGQRVEPSIDLYPLRERDAFLPSQNERAWVIGRIFHFVKDFYDFVPRAGWVDAKGKERRTGGRVYEVIQQCAT